MQFHEVTLTKGFWKDLYDRNADVSIYAVQKQFEDTGRFEGLRFTHAEKPDVPLHFFFDSDAAKWIEAVGYLLKTDREKYADLETFCDELIDSMEKHQQADGYLNSYFQQIDPEHIFKGRDNHELYCIGHLVEAAIAYDEGTGKRKFLEVMKRVLDCVNTVFIKEKSAPYLTCGHQEIKLALMRLYDYTKEPLYLEMASHFIHIRGNNDIDFQKPMYDFANEYYSQDNAPATELAEADGHAVRACYYYTAMAHLADVTKDEKLKVACKRLYESITQKKMYVTGGIGATRIGESFTSEYALPNSTAYSESCAAISLIFFCERMMRFDHDAKYANTIERVLYNGFLSSTSLDGKSFFYENPLEICLQERDIERSIPHSHRIQYPITERLEVFGCSCCPPNINRVMASIAQYIYTEERDMLYIEQFIPSVLKKYGVELITSFPMEDTITVKANGYPFKKLAIRIPDWCDKPTFSKKYTAERGYAIFDVEENFTLDITYPQKAKFVYANTKVYSDVGRVALTYGPVVYCLEGVDNGGTLTDVFVNTKSKIKALDGDFQPLRRFALEGARVTLSESLYSYTPPKKEKITLTFIPYYTFANRGEQNMQVWVNAL